MKLVWGWWFAASLLGCATIHEERFEHLGTPISEVAFQGYELNEALATLVPVPDGGVALSFKTGSTCLDLRTTTTPRTQKVVRTGNGGTVAAGVITMLTSGVVAGTGAYGPITTGELRATDGYLLISGGSVALVALVLTIIEGARGADSVEIVDPLVRRETVSRTCRPVAIADHQLQVTVPDGGVFTLTTSDEGLAAVPDALAEAWTPNLRLVDRTALMTTAQSTVRWAWSEPALAHVTTHKDTPQAWAAYLAAFPSGPLAAHAQRRLDLEEGSKKLQHARAAFDEGRFDDARRLLSEARGLSVTDQAFTVRLDEAIAARQAEKDAEVERSNAEKSAEVERWNAEWGRFETWRARAKNRELVATWRRFAEGAKRRVKLKELLERETHRNDDAVREEDISVIPLFPEVSGAFAFLKILDRSDGEALFMADDGPFVLRLSPGDSFNAFPGQSVQMTMYSRGERMLMSTGQRLPVFLSGSSPSRVRRVPGFKPNRAKENALRKRLAAELASALDTFRRETGVDDPEQRGPLRRFPGATLSWDDDADAYAEMRDGTGRVVFCVELGLACRSSPGESIGSDELLGAR